ncbi:hypothetical protein C0J52_10368 [Blattella germanica]|nr:hypothetical protein C0J52_10368 [Blattella germanica]
MVARMVLETLKAVADDPSDVSSVITVFNKLSDDPEGPIRAELMEQVPHIAMLCREDAARLNFIVSDHLLPLIVKYLADSENQVRKTAQAVLLVLMEQGLIEQSAVEEKVCPVILRLSEMDSLVEFHTGAVALMSKMAPLIGSSSTERLFLNRFATLCTDPVFYVRKFCAANFGEFCAVVGTNSMESVLLPRFVDLCADDIWGVRKACAETFMSVSCACTLETRKQSLAPIFANLLVDQSRWVRMSAYQTLGPFISTFADPSITGLSYNEDRELVILSPEGFEFRVIDDMKLCTMTDFNKAKDSAKTDELNSEKSEFGASDAWAYIEENGSVLVEEQENALVEERKNVLVEEREKESDLVEKQEKESDLVEEQEKGCVLGEEQEKETILVEKQENVIDEEKGKENIVVEKPENVLVEQGTVLENKKVQELDVDISTGSKPAHSEKSQEQQLRVHESGGQVHIRVDNSGVDSFNTFQYWRVPIPELELDISLADTGKPTAVHVKATVTDTQRQCTYGSELNVDVEMDPDMENLLSRFVGRFGGERAEEKPIQAQISTSSVSMMTEGGMNGAESKTIVTSAAQKSVTLFRSGEAKKTTPTKKMECKPCNTESWGFAEQWDNQQQTQSVSQDIVPQELIDHFVSMTHPSQAHKTDNEIAHHCAYSLPAVALTLGRENWTLLKEAYNALASDMQWKVRRTVASSIHQLAVILGEDLATKDLVPIFNGFIKDLDEVRIGALKHLAEFLKLLRPQERNSYLPRLSEFLLTDNEWNWRFREELAEQLLAAVTLFSPEDTRKHLTPIAISLLLDKVAAVRQVALSLMSEVVRHVSQRESLIHGVMAELAEWFAHKFFAKEGTPEHEILIQVLRRLQTDRDRDVLYFASLCRNTNVEEEEEEEVCTI